jgi:hypothetical protein
MLTAILATWLYKLIKLEVETGKKTVKGEGAGLFLLISLVIDGKVAFEIIEAAEKIFGG